MVGRATLVMVKSTMVMKKATANKANARQRLTGASVYSPPGASPTRAGDVVGMTDLSVRRKDISRLRSPWICRTKV